MYYDRRLGVVCCGGSWCRCRSRVPRSLSFARLLDHRAPRTRSRCASCAGRQPGVRRIRREAAGAPRAGVADHRVDLVDQQHQRRSIGLCPTTTALAAGHPQVPPPWSTCGQVTANDSSPSVVPCWSIRFAPLVRVGIGQSTVARHHAILSPMSFATAPHILEMHCIL